MYSVTQIANYYKQPHGGFIKLSEFEHTIFNGSYILSKNENIHPSLIGLVIDYMSRFLTGSSIEDAFHISIIGAYCVDELNIIFEYLNNIKGFDNNSMFYACKAVGYDVAYRAGIQYFKNTNHINPNKETINNIKILLTRTLDFFNNVGPIIESGFDFEGAYTNIISSGDGDFLTKDTLFDLKVLKNKPNSKNILQILIYYLMGKKSINKNFNNIENIGFFNPRLNDMYVLNVSNINNQILENIEKIIGY